jgi:hypothetical protein
MSKATKRKKSYRYYRRRRLKRTSLISYLGFRLMELSIVLVAIFVAIYAFSFLKKIRQPTVKRQEDLIFARTQILKASPDGDDALGAVMEKLKEMKANNIAHQIVEIGDLEAFGNGESMILDRMGGTGKKGPSRVALLTAEALGIPARNVVCKELKDNYKGISLTIVIGSDWGVLLSGT